MRERDPAAAWRRTTRAQRRAAVGAVCACGESPAVRADLRPRAAVLLCLRPDRARPRPCEDDHPFGQHNADLTVRVPVNDHRAVLSVAQYQWPPETLQNPDGDPFLASARAVPRALQHLRVHARRLPQRSRTAGAVERAHAAEIRSAMVVRGASRESGRKTDRKAERRSANCRSRFASIPISKAGLRTPARNAADSRRDPHVRLRKPHRPSASAHLRQLSLRRR